MPQHNTQERVKGLETAKVNKTKEPNNTATLQNGWGGVFYYAKNDLNQIWLSGYLTPGTKTAGTVITTLPVGYRPSIHNTFIVYAGENANVLTGFVVLSDGSVIITNPASSATFISVSINTIFQA